MAGNISNAVKYLLRTKPIYIFNPELLYIGNRNQTFFLNSRTLNPLFPQPALPYHTGVVNFHHSSLHHALSVQKFNFLLNNQRCHLYNSDIGKTSLHDSSKGAAENATSDNSKMSTTSAAPVQLSRRDKLKRAIKEYGTTVIVFHVAISLVSLGGFYLLVSSGVNVQGLFDQVGLNISSNVATGASTFVMAYAVHKVFAPVRISITLASTPFIVRYLRRIGFLKPPKPSSTTPTTPS